MTNGYDVSVDIIEVIVAKAPSGSELYRAIISSTTPRTIDSAVGGRERLTPRSNSIWYVSEYTQTGMLEPVTYRFLGSLHCISCSETPALYCSNGDGYWIPSIVSDKAYTGNTLPTTKTDNIPKSINCCIVSHVIHLTSIYYYLKDQSSQKVSVHVPPYQFCARGLPCSRMRLWLIMRRPSEGASPAWQEQDSLLAVEFET